MAHSPQRRGQTFRARAFAPTPDRSECHSSPQLRRGGCFLWNDSESELQALLPCLGQRFLWAALHFSPRMPNPWFQLHLDFIFPPFEVAQAVEYIDATVDALPSREFKFPANINTESTFQGEILDLRG